jgi:hypothetical protein
MSKPSTISLQVGASPSIRNARIVAPTGSPRTAMEDVENRLAKLYDALETGEFKGGELASRIKTMFEKKDKLERAKVEAEERLKYHTIELASPEVVHKYVQSMKTLLTDSEIMKRKSFLRFFMDRIEVDDSWANFIYTWPKDNPPTELVGVLPIIHDGPPLKIHLAR